MDATRLKSIIRKSESFSELLAGYVKRSSLTYDKIAKASRITKGYLSEVVRGEARPPSADVIERLGPVLDYDAGYMKAVAEYNRLSDDFKNYLWELAVAGGKISNQNNRGDLDTSKYPEALRAFINSPECPDDITTEELEELASISASEGELSEEQYRGQLRTWRERPTDTVLRLLKPQPRKIQEEIRNLVETYISVGSVPE